MELVVTDREGIEEGVLVRSSYIVISIHDPDRRKAKVKRQSGLRGVLHLAFHDAEPTSSPALDAQVTLMTPDHARQIWAFVEKHRNEVGAVLVHCEAGMSRSPAVAAALCKVMGGDERRFWREYQPNMHVYRLMIEAANGRAG